jgi:uncharacterized protein (TIGR02996 family)
MSNDPRPGRLISNEERQRDAIHVALAPVQAAEWLSPGQHIGFTQPCNVSLVGAVEETIGVVDPFLTAEVEPGQRFWMFLYPNSVTGLRHIWSHPAFNAAASICLTQDEGGSATATPASRSIREDFLAALAEDEDDLETRLVFSDWLDDQGEHEEAERHRKWSAAKQWLSEFVKHHNQDDEEEAWESKITYQDLLEFGHRAIVEDDYYFSCGSNETMSSALGSYCAEFWQCWSTLTGIAAPADAVEKSEFRCAC